MTKNGKILLDIVQKNLREAASTIEAQISAMDAANYDTDDYRDAKSALYEALENLSKADPFINRFFENLP